MRYILRYVSLTRTTFSALNKDQILFDGCKVYGARFSDGQQNYEGSFYGVDCTSSRGNGYVCEIPAGEE